MLYDSNGFKPYIYYFSKLVHVPHKHTHTYSIGPVPKSVEYQFLGQILKFLELRGSFHRTCPGLEFLAYRGGLGVPLRTLGLFSSSTPSLAAVKGSLGDFGSSPLNPFGFLEM
jgi:hypothetical protein